MEAGQNLASPVAQDAPAAKPQNFFSRLIGVIFSPGETFAEIGRAPRVLILAGPDDEFGAVEAHDAGAAAFLRKPRSAADLLETLELATLLIQTAVPLDVPQND